MTAPHIRRAAFSAARADVNAAFIASRRRAEAVQPITSLPADARPGAGEKAAAEGAAREDGRGAARTMGRNQVIAEITAKREALEMRVQKDSDEKKAAWEEEVRKIKAERDARFDYGIESGFERRVKGYGEYSEAGGADSVKSAVAAQREVGDTSAIASSTPKSVATESTFADPAAAEPAAAEPVVAAAAKASSKSVKAVPVFAEASPEPAAAEPVVVDSVPEPVAAEPVVAEVAPEHVAAEAAPEHVTAEAAPEHVAAAVPDPVPSAAKESPRSASPESSSVAASPAAESPDDLKSLIQSGSLKNMTVSKLRVLLAENRLKTSGRKAELVARLKAFARSE